MSKQQSVMNMINKHCASIKRNQSLLKIGMYTTTEERHQIELDIAESTHVIRRTMDLTPNAEDIPSCPQECETCEGKTKCDTCQAMDGFVHPQHYWKSINVSHAEMIEQMFDKVFRNIIMFFIMMKNGKLSKNRYNGYNREESQLDYNWVMGDDNQTDVASFPNCCNFMGYDAPSIRNAFKELKQFPVERIQKILDSFHKQKERIIFPYMEDEPEKTSTVSIEASIFQT